MMHHLELLALAGALVLASLLFRRHSPFTFGEDAQCVAERLERENAG